MRNHYLVLLLFLFTGCLSKLDVAIKEGAVSQTPEVTLLTSLSVAQEQGSLTVMNRLMIRGVGLLNLNKAYVENIECIIISKTDSEVSCDIMASLPADWYDIELTDTNGKIETIVDGYASGAVVIGTSTFQKSSTEPIGMLPFDVEVIDSQLFVTDTTAFYRVLKFNTVPTSTVAPDKVTFGRADFSISGAIRMYNATPVNSTNLNQPNGVCKSNNQFFITDTAYHRILVFNSIPTNWGQTPDFVLGQRTLTTSTSNLEGISASSLNAPRGIYCDDNYIIVADANNHRVLIWNAPIDENFQAADLVIGQADFISNSANRGGTVQNNTLNTPTGVHFKNNYLFIADTNSNRILIYHGIPALSGASANQVLGQTLFTTSSSGITQSKFNRPTDIFLSPTSLWIADKSNHRVLGWNLSSAINTWANGRNADLVLGQSDFISRLVNKGGAPSLATMREPYGVYEYGTQLFVADSQNKRVLAWNSIPTTNGQAASFQLGQNSSSDADQFPSLANNKNVTTPRGAVVSNSGKVYVLEYENTRVTRFPSVTANYPTADLVLGQPDLNTAMNLPPLGVVTATNFLSPQSIFWDSIDDDLFVSSCNHHRVMVWTTEPTTNDAAPNIYLGQPDSVTILADVTAQKLNYPVGVCRAGSHLFVSDFQNNRIVRYTYPLSTGMAADLVLGQADFVSKLANQGTTASANTLSSPWELHCDDDRLIVSDYGNSRVLIWDGLPTVNNEAADVVLGQPDFLTTAALTTISQSTLNQPRGLSFRNGRLVVVDSSNHRLLVWDSIPTQNAAPADHVIGQLSFDLRIPNKYSSAEVTLGGFQSPLMVKFLDDDRIMVGTNNAGQIQIIPLPKVP